MLKIPIFAAASAVSVVLLAAVPASAMPVSTPVSVTADLPGSNVELAAWNGRRMWMRPGGPPIGGPRMGGWNNNWHGGGWNNWNGGWHHHDHDHDHDHFYSSFAFGVAPFASYGYGYGYPGYGYGYPNYGYGYGGDSHVNYCLSRYRSYDPASNTFMGYDGLRHPCL